jgi:hypothetical protein
MAELLFDPASVPADVLSQDGVTEVNTLIEKLRSRLVDRVQMQEPGSGFRVSNMARVYSQAHLRRCLQLIEAAHDLVYTGRGLAALTLVRSLYETVANYVAVSQQLVELIEANAPLQEIHNFIHTRAYATRLEHLIKVVDTEEVKPTNILTQVGKMKRLRADFEKQYEYLSEHTHPKPDKPEPNRRFRRRSALGHTGYFWMICRFTSARIFPQRGCKLSEPNGFKPLRPIHHRIICALSRINFAHKRQ